MEYKKRNIYEGVKASEKLLTAVIFGGILVLAAVMITGAVLAK